jgi:hypothetical protein
MRRWYSTSLIGTPRRTIRRRGAAIDSGRRIAAGTILGYNMQSLPARKTAGNRVARFRRF